MTKQEISYERAPSEELHNLLAPGGFLSPICDLHRNGCLDVHFRGGDEIHAYRGLTRLFDIKRMRSGTLRVKAAKAHMQYDPDRRFFRDWQTGDSMLLTEMENYRRHVPVGSRHTSMEGCVQMTWSRVTEPWIPFDREARLRYSGTDHRKKVKAFDEVRGAYEELWSNYEEHQNKVGRDRWREPKKTAIKVDQLAIDPDGRLVLIELKHASSVYYSPFQLLQYVWEWSEALKNAPKLLGQVQQLLKARTDLRLIEAPVPSLTNRIRAAVCFGSDGRSDEVKRRYRFVLNICNHHLPDGMAIETWEYDDVEGPRPCPP